MRLCMTTRRDSRLGVPQFGSYPVVERVNIVVRRLTYPTARERCSPNRVIDLSHLLQGVYYDGIERLLKNVPVIMISI
jgi:hypothetical protein